MAELLANTPSPGTVASETTLSGNGGSITAGATTLKTAGAAPAALQGGQFRILIDAEWMLVTAGQSGTTWTVTRGIEGSTAAAHNDGASIYHVWTAGGLAAYLTPGVGFYQTVQAAGATQTQRAIVNFAQGQSVTITPTDDSPNNRTTLTLAVTSIDGGASA